MTNRESIANKRKELEELRKQLEKEEKELHDEEVRVAKLKANRFLNYLRENRDVVLSLIKHDRTSCSDEHPCNGIGSAEYGARCKKCLLIDILNDEWRDDYEVRFDVEIYPIK